MPVKKIPPPPPLPGVEFQPFNRWLLEFQSILNAEGVIDPDNVQGLVTAYVQIDTNTADIVTLGAVVAALVPIVTGNTTNIAALQIALAALTGRVTTLEARGEVLNGAGAPAGALGKINDWYADTAGLNIYVKTAVATWTLII